MFPLEARNSSAEGPEYCDVVKVQEKDLVFMNKIEILNEETN